MTERTAVQQADSGQPSPDSDLDETVPGCPDTPARPGGQAASQRRTGEPLLASAASWAVLTASFGLSASTWIALAQLAGFTGHLSAPGLYGYELTFRLAWLMPVAVDGYVVTALVLWMAPVPTKVAEFARKNTYAAASVGVAAQSAYHSLTVWSDTGALWRAGLAALVGAMPPAVAALAVHMRALIRRESGQVAGTREATVLVAAAPHPDTASNPAEDATGQAADTDDRTPATVTDLSDRTHRAAVADTSIEALADTLTGRFREQYVGTPAALTELKRVHGSCSKDRAIAAKKLHNARREVAAEVTGNSEEDVS